jgi:glycosyltransferase EpsD
MKKILYVANTDRHILLCHLPYLKMLKEEGYTVHVATNSNINLPYCDKKIFLPITRNPFHLSNIRSIFLLRKQLKSENYDLISCHTPMGGTVARFAAKRLQRHNKIKVLYTVHGFHFYKGSKLINWILYYPIEKYLSKYTNIVITINDEDYKFAKEHFKIEIRQIPGIGFNEDKLYKTNLNVINYYKNKYNINNNDFVISYIAEISKRKRQLNLLKIFKSFDYKKEHLKLLLIGDSILKKPILFYIKKYHLESNVIYIPFISDINPFLDLSDLVISVSSQEGLPLNIMEAMYKNKKILATNIRGQSDLLKYYNNGKLFDLNKDDLCKLIILMKKRKISKKTCDMSEYSYHNTTKIMLKIIKSV